MYICLLGINISTMKTHLPAASEHISNYLSDFKEVAINHYGKRLKQLVLYGSYARGDHYPGSDIDVLVVINNLESEAREIDTLAGLKTDLLLEYGIYLSTNPVDSEKFEQSRFSFFRNVKREGVLL